MWGYARVVWLLFVVFASASCGGGGGGSGGLGLGLAPLGNPGASGILDIKATALPTQITLAQGEQASFTVTAEVINQGTNSRGLSVTASAGCLRHSACRSEPSKFPTRGTSTVTLYSTMLTPVGLHTLNVTVYEEHTSALGFLGPIVRTSRVVPVTVEVTPSAEPLSFRHRSQRMMHIGSHGPNLVRNGDFDGDGAADDMLASASYGRWELLLGAEEDRLESVEVDLGPSARDILITDVNKDGYDDVLAGSVLGLSYFETINDPPHFLEPQTVLGGSPIDLIRYFDADTDGVDDLLAYSREAGTLILVRVTESGLEPVGEVGAIGDDVRRIEYLDFDGDGDLDLAAAGVGLELYRNDGAGTFSYFNTPLGTPRIVDMLTADVDGDMVTDIVVAGDGQHEVLILQGDGVAGFVEGARLATGFPPTQVEVVDVNRDGLIDVLALVPDVRRLSIYLNTGGLTFEEAIHLPAPIAPHRFLVADLNGDTWPDFALTGWYEPIEILLNTSGS